MRLHLHAALFALHSAPGKTKVIEIGDVAGTVDDKVGGQLPLPQRPRRQHRERPGCAVGSAGAPSAPLPQVVGVDKDGTTEDSN